ncbi:hypothetical protein [Kribbella sp. NPDC051718]|uniref:hypothetical protein n=1 Tax=Kribbella sp. NPDC051718 TaxID=3155168 RepID=UPI00343EDB28
MKVQASYLHERIAFSVFTEEMRNTALDAIRTRTDRFSDQFGRWTALQESIGDYLAQNEIPELGVAIASNAPLSGRLVIFTQKLYFRRQSNSHSTILMHGTLDSDASVKLQAELSTEWTVGTTGRKDLSGTRRTTVLAYIQDIDTIGVARLLHLRPIFIGHQINDEVSPIFSLASDDRREVFPSQIDQFKLRGFDTELTNADIKSVSRIPEKEIKARFARILGEVYTNPDWGGERSDLFTDKATMNGLPKSLAFALKDPGLKAKLTIDKMGKNADQALRLFTEPADICIVQHHREIDPQVRNFLSALARQNSQYFMVIDGRPRPESLRRTSY